MKLNHWEHREIDLLAAKLILLAILLTVPLLMAAVLGELAPPAHSHNCHNHPKQLIYLCFAVF